MENIRRRRRFIEIDRLDNFYKNDQNKVLKTVQLFHLNVIYKWEEI